MDHSKRCRSTNRKLKGLIHARFDSEADMARQLGWTKQRLNKITNGKEPSLREVDALATALNMTLDDIASLFLSESHQTDNNQIA